VTDRQIADRQTERQTDGIAMAYTRYSIGLYAVARNKMIAEPERLLSKAIPAYL